MFIRSARASTVPDDARSLSGKSLNQRHCLSSRDHRASVTCGRKKNKEWDQKVPLAVAWRGEALAAAVAPQACSSPDRASQFLDRLKNSSPERCKVPGRRVLSVFDRRRNRPSVIRSFCKLSHHSPVRDRVREMTQYYSKARQTAKNMITRLPHNVNAAQRCFSGNLQHHQRTSWTDWTHLSQPRSARAVNRTRARKVASSSFFHLGFIYEIASAH